MAKMGNYCKAYQIKDLIQFEGWKENVEQYNNLKKSSDNEQEDGNNQFDEKSIVYLHDNYYVTKGIYNDEDILFENVNDEWKMFCKNKLNFIVPDFHTKEVKQEASALKK